MTTNDQNIKLLADIYKQPEKRQKQLLKNAVKRLGEVGGLSVIRLSVPDYLRLINSTTTEQDDPMKQMLSLENINKLMGNVKVKDPTTKKWVYNKCFQNNVNMKQAVECLIDQYNINKQCDAQLFVAFVPTKERTFQLRALATCARFQETENFSTTEDIIGEEVFKTLKPYFKKKYYYIDCLCSLGSGAGHVLALHAFEFAHRKDYKGLVAMSYSKNMTDRPASEEMFKGLGFQSILEDEWRPAQTDDFSGWGIWFLKDTYDFSGLKSSLESMLRLCTRTGLTKTTENNLIWRCMS